MYRLALAILLVAGFSVSVQAKNVLLDRVGKWRITFIGSEKGKQVGGWCWISQDNSRAVGRDSITIFGPQTPYRSLIDVPQFRVGIRKPIGYQIDGGPIEPIKAEWIDGKFVYLRVPGIVQQMLSGHRIVIHQEPLKHRGVVVPNLEYTLQHMKQAMEWFENPVCLEDLRRSE